MLRERIRVERKEAVSDGYSSGSDEWVVLATVAAMIKPMTGGRSSETPVADKLAGLNMWEIKVRSSAALRSLKASDRIIDHRDASRVFNIKQVSNPDQKDQYLTIIAETGKPDQGGS